MNCEVHPKISIEKKINEFYSGVKPIETLEIDGDVVSYYCVDCVKEAHKEQERILSVNKEMIKEKLEQLGFSCEGLSKCRDLELSDNVYLTWEVFNCGKVAEAFYIIKKHEDRIKRLI